MKIKRENEMKVTLTIMVFIMTLLVTFIGMVVNYGVHAGFTIKWMKSWGLAFLVALPVMFLVMPVIKKTLSSHIID